jgi:DNA-binding NarL/FixJ family response regulator
MFAAMGMEAFAERTHRELIATGETARKRSADTRHDLTPQEEQIARLVRDRLSNQEIAAQLFLSSRTVEWHLRKGVREARNQVASRATGSMGAQRLLATHATRCSFLNGNR